VTISAGARLGHYEIRSKLGEGGMGEVWRARDTRLNREVAIKVLPAALAKDAGRLRRFEQEAMAASALNHPSIVTIHEIGKTDAGRFIVMELVRGQTLRAVSKPCAIDLLVNVGSQILFYDREQDFASAKAAREGRPIRDFRELPGPEATSDGAIPYPTTATGAAATGAPRS